MAYEDIRNPVSQKRGGVSLLVGIPIRYTNTDFISYIDMISDKGKNCADLDLIGKMKY